MALTQTEVSQLYVSIFGRASEGEGNTFWQATSDAATAATNMLATDAAATYFGDSLDTDLAFVTHIYENTLGKGYAEDASGIDFWTAALANMTRGELVASLIDSIMSPDNAGLAAQDMFINQVAVSDYTADTIELPGDDLSVFAGFIAGVTDDEATVTTAQASVDAVANPVVGFTLTAGLTDLADATAALATFNTDNPDVVADLDSAQTTYEGLTVVGGDDVTTDSAALSAAYRSDTITANATVLADAQEALADANALVAAVSGLTAAVAAETVAFDADAASGLALIAADNAETVELASYTALVGTKADIGGIDSADATGIQIDSTLLGNDLVLAELDVDANRLVLTDADVAYDADELELFNTYQADAADLMASANAALAALEVDTLAIADLATATATVAYLDLDTADANTAVTMGLMGAGFTLTDVGSAAAPTEAEVASETLALSVAATASQEVVDGALTALGGAVTAADIADADTNDEATAASIIDTGTIAVTRDGNDVITVVQADLGAGLVDLITVGGDVAAFAAAVDLVGHDATLDALLVAVQVDIDAVLADNLADQAVIDFGTLVSNFEAANNVNPLTVGLGALETAVTDAEDDITDFADAITELDAAVVDAADLTALTEAVTAAEDALDDAGFDSIITVDAASEFGTAADDVFVVGTVDSSIYSLDLQGDDTVFVGTDAVYNDTLIGSVVADGETALVDAGDVLALEMFLVDTGANVDVVIETENYGSETGDTTTITLIGVTDIADVTIADGFITVA